MSLSLNLRKPGWGTVFAALLVLHFCFCLVGWNHSVLEHHRYRQAHTAVTISYMIEENAWIDYITPALGPPWQAPLEFPFYQMVVAGLCLLLHAPVEQTGRGVALFFFYASLWPTNQFLKYLVPERKFRYMMLCLPLLAPVYIYFSRTIMMESTALFLGFCFLLSTARQMDRFSKAGMSILLLSGSLCALVKITTFCAFCFPCLIVPFLNRFHYSEGSLIRRKLQPLEIIRILLPAYGIPLLFGMAWTRHADQIKLASPATADLTSASLNSWVFGSLSQRLDPQVWMDVLARLSLALTFYPFLVVIFAAMVFLGRKERSTLGLLLISAIIPPVVFLNLYSVHEYYFYASSIFLIFAIGYLLACLMRKGSKLGIILWLAVTLSFVIMYGSFLFRVQWGQNLVLPPVMEAIGQNSKKGDYLLIYGEHWDSTIPYLTKRKAFMNYFYKREDILKFDETLERIEGWDRIRVAVINTEMVPIEPYLTEHLSALGFSSEPDLLINGFAIFKKKGFP